MQIRRLKIDNHKCLVDFEINFTTTDGGSSTILIGENGTGKSTMMESVLEILMSFDSDAIEKKIDYDYEFEYLYGGRIITIYQRDKVYQINIGDEIFCMGKMETVRKYISRQPIFPERINYFYSGAKNKVLHSINRGNINYATKCRSAITRYWRTVVWDNHDYEGEFPKRKYNYCADSLTPIYLISILGGQESFEKRYLQDQCHMAHIETITFSLDTDNLPHSLQEEVLNGGTEWIYEIIDFIDDRFSDVLRRGFMYDNENLLFFELRDISELGLDSISIFNFFEKLVTVFDAEYSVYISVGDSRVDCNDLSEGQRQLIKILGMLGVCKNEDTLVLMDEPDAHMNPAWKYSLKATIDECLRDAVNTQAIIATHDPLVINGVEKEYIRIFTHNQGLVRNNNWYFTKVVEPTEDTSGMGIDGILQSEYYGLNSTLDTHTQDILEAKRTLMVKKKEGTISSEETTRLQELTDQIESLGFTKNIPTDNYYDEFVVAMQKYYDNRPRITLTAEEIEERNHKALEIIERLMNP